MQLRYFVTLCSVILIMWLGVAFFHEVPFEHDQERDVAEALSPVEELEAAEAGPEAIAENDEFAVSVSP